MLETQNKSQTPSAETANGNQANQPRSKTADQAQATNRQDLSSERIETNQDSLLVKSTQAAIAHEGQQGFRTVKKVERPNFLENFGNTIRGHGIDGTKTEQTRIPIVSTEPSSKESTTEAAAEPSKKPAHSEEPTNQTAHKLEEEKTRDSLHTAA
jgi:hypothetical protein